MEVPEVVFFNFLETISATVMEWFLKRYFFVKSSILKSISYDERFFPSRWLEYELTEIWCTSPKTRLLDCQIGIHHDDNYPQLMCNLIYWIFKQANEKSDIDKSTLVRYAVMGTFAYSPILYNWYSIQTRDEFLDLKKYISGTNGWIENFREQQKPLLLKNLS